MYAASPFRYAAALASTHLALLPALLDELRAHYATLTTEDREALLQLLLPWLRALAAAFDRAPAELAHAVEESSSRTPAMLPPSGNAPTGTALSSEERGDAVAGFGVDGVCVAELHRSLLAPAVCACLGPRASRLHSPTCPLQLPSPRPFLVYCAAFTRARSCARSLTSLGSRPAARAMG